MAIINRYIQQAAGTDNLTLDQLSANHASAGLYILEEPISLYQDDANSSIFYIGSQVGSTLYKTYDKCSVSLFSDVFHSPDQPNIFEPTVQIIYPYNDNEATIEEFFIRFNNESGTWSTLTKFNSGDSVRGILEEKGFHLVDNTDPSKPIILSDRTKVDKLENYTFTGGSNYKVGDIISTSEKGMNAQVIQVDPATGAIEKIALTEEPVTESEGINATVTINTGVKGALVEFDEFGRLIPSVFKGTYVKPYEFTY